MSARLQKTPLGLAAGKRVTDASLRAKGTATPPRFPQPDYERLRRLAMFYEPSTPPRSLLARIAGMPVIFAIGALFGLGTAWWGMTSGANPFANAFEKWTSASKPALPRSREFAAANGIAVGELPYDGGASRSSDQEESASSLRTNPDELPHSESSGILSSAVEGLQQELREESASLPAISPRAASNAKPEPPAVSGKRGGQSTAQATTNEKKIMKTPHKRRVGQRVMKDREIERIRQQASEELKKKTENRRVLEGGRARSRASAKKLSAQARASSTTAKSSGIRAQLEKCKQASNLIQREQCQWRTCVGKWGKNGCPSYAQQAASS